MSQQSEIAYQHQAQRIALGHRASVVGLNLWRRMDINALEPSWNIIAPVLTNMVTSAQVIAARQATPYLNAIDGSYGRDSGDYVLNAAAFGGVTLEGRQVGPGLYGAVTHTKTLIGQGVAPMQAFQSGAAFLATVVKTSIADMGRAADHTLATARNYTMYVRVCNGSACSRCAILAGSWSGRDAFLRHAGCQCSAVPIEGKGAKDIPDGLFTDPQAFFDSLSKEQQDKTFTKDGAWAIRHGASPQEVVNVRRGAYGIGYSGHKELNIPHPGTHGTLQPVTIGRKADGTPLQVYATTEGTTIRGRYGRRQYNAGQELVKGTNDRYRHTTRLRLMPEQIHTMAGNDPQRTVELLQRYGYLTETGAEFFGVSAIR